MSHIQGKKNYYPTSVSIPNTCLANCHTYRGKNTKFSRR
nr:MAG TPA: Integrin alpha-V, Integrin beta-3 DOMAIN, PSI, EGF REPEATS [Caudoviricetes sp.]